MKQDFVLDVVYDDDSYTAMSDASWQMFRREHLTKRAYPVILIMFVMIVLSLVGSWDSMSNLIKICGSAFAAFLLLVFPLSKVDAKWKMKHDAIKKLKKENMFPMYIHFVFTGSTIYAEVKGRPGSIIRYSDITEYTALGKWRFIFFGQASYIFHETDFASPEEFERFDNFVGERSGFKPLLLKGEGPKRLVRKTSASVEA